MDAVTPQPYVNAVTAKPHASHDSIAGIRSLQHWYPERQYAITAVVTAIPRITLYRRPDPLTPHINPYSLDFNPPPLILPGQTIVFRYSIWLDPDNHIDPNTILIPIDAIYAVINPDNSLSPLNGFAIINSTNTVLAADPTPTQYIHNPIPVFNPPPINSIPQHDPNKAVRIEVWEHQYLGTDLKRLHAKDCIQLS